MNEIIKQNRTISMSKNKLKKLKFMRTLAKNFFSSPIKLSNQCSNKMIGESVSKACQCSCQLALVNVPTIVSIEWFETILPICDVFPQSSEILKADATAILSVEHADHQANCFMVEGLPGTIWEGLLEFICTNEATSIAIDSVNGEKFSF